ncbi:hypothetical protein [Candidatus Solincola sp.]|jgi:hypothetical protein|nr:hypothetical protein [Actinomycetota bacterium]
MQTTEKIVESYCNYVKGWATIPNIKCDKGQYEIDLIAIDPRSGEKYHIECSVHITASFSKLTANKFSEEKLKKRVEAPKQRMTIGFFQWRKFEVAEVKEKLEQYGFQHGKYKKVIVAEGWTEDAEKQAQEYGIELWNFNGILKDLIEFCGKSSKYYEDDTLRTMQLLLRAQGRRR